MTEFDPDPEDLWWAARDGNIEEVTYLLNQYHQISDYIDHRDDDYGTTPLIVAIQFSHVFNRRPGPDFDLTDGHLEVVELLISRGADVSVECDEGNTALYWTVRNAPSNEYLDLLLETPGIDINKKVDGRTALMDAVASKCYRSRQDWKHQVSAILCHHGIDTNTLDGKGNSLLHQVSSADEWLLKQLKPFNIDINRICNGRTPLLCAIEKERMSFRLNGEIRNGFAGVVKALLISGADIQITDDEGRTAVEAAESFVPVDEQAMLILREREFRDKFIVFATGTHRGGNHPDCRLHNFSPEIVRKIMYPGENNL
jgi:hypothetical protein